ncbi:MAG: HAMP domain-containing histidine kinase [Myxococcales bacterium]|nr:HAMP domain-containing histidine kinase [Myxococcales bacterium]
MTRTPRSRRALLGVVGLLFLVTAAIALWRVLALRELAVERERTRLQQIVEDHVAAWEDALFTELAGRLDQVAADVDQAEAWQHRWRASRPWIDSVFVWVPGGPDHPTQQIFPLPSTPDASQRRQLSPCVARAQLVMVERPDDVDAVVDALVPGCRAEEPSIRLASAIRAATLLVGAGRGEDALAVLDATSLPDKLSLREAARKGVDPVQLAAHRTLRLDLMLRNGQTDRALDLAARVGEQLAELDAPDLAAVNPHMREVWQILVRAGRTQEAAQLADQFARAGRRYRAYGEVRDRLLLEQSRVGSPGRMVVDAYAYSERPFLLYYGWSGPFGIAFALEEGPLVENFLHSRIRGLQSALTLTDARSGRYVAGARKGGRYAITIPFPRSLTHLRVNVRQAAIDGAVVGSSEQWIVPGAIITFCLALALFMLAAVDRAMQQQVELLDRQRAFSTRVTHELKTPLAGIRVMAENLEIGAFKDDGQRRDMARRIVQEADNLTRRVDEVLSVARERTIPSPKPFDVEELVYVLMEEWGPRYDDAGVTFSVDAAPTDPVLGDATAMRDAIACLLDNALKYRNEARPDPRVDLTLTQEGNQVVVAVTDNGLGVPKAMRRKVFDRFVRVEGPHRGKAGGHGLGLHQVKEIVVAHKGSVACLESPGGGASFVLRLPADPS